MSARVGNPSATDAAGLLDPQSRALLSLQLRPKGSPKKDQGTDRTSKRTNLLRKREFDRLRAADYRARKKARDRLPGRINATIKRGKELVKAAKGLDD